MNATYRDPTDLPTTIPVFPLPQALLLPRGRMPLNIFEPRYLAMVDSVIGAGRIIGMVQPEPEERQDGTGLYAVGCAGRVTQWAETGDGRYLIALAGIARFTITAEEEVVTPFRQCRVDFSAYAADLRAGHGEDEVDRTAVLTALKAFATTTGIAFDWEDVERASNEILVNALSMLAPFGVREKQALLEAATLKERGETLVALTEIELARTTAPASTETLQ